MNDDSTNRGSTFRQRFSLSTILVAVALVACGIIIWRQWQQVVLLRQEVQRFRKEAGYPQIADPSKVHILAAEKRDTVQDWWWRLHIPTGANYSVNIYSGPWPTDAYLEPGHVLRPEVFNNLQDESRGVIATYPFPDGEFQLNARMGLTSLGNNMELTPGGTLELPNWRPTSGSRQKVVPVITGGSKLRVLQPGQPALLIQLLETRSGAMQLEEVGSNCIAVWIGQQTSQLGGAAGTKKTRNPAD